MNAKRKATIAIALVAGLMVTPAVAFARHGADDPAGHDQGDDHGGHRSRTTLVEQRSGNDDPSGHDQGDDNGGVSSGNDDPAGHDQGDDNDGS
jgi:hypothetical protein